MDVRRRISFNMNTGSEEPTEPSTGTYTVNLNSQWEKTTAVPNPDSTLYDGVYRSSSNYNVNNGVAIMYIDISGYSEFTLYIRSYAESTYDYVMVSQLDQTITGSSSYSDTTLIKAHTRGNQQSGTAISNYTEVKFTNIDGGSHRINILYRKDSSANSGDDRGYLLIKGGVSGGGGSGDVTGPINTDNYLTILALENGLTASLSTNACQYCIDGDGNWYDLPSGTTTQAINQGQTLSFKGNLTPDSSNGIGTFTINKKCNLEGNCMSVLFGDDAANNYNLSKTNAFYKLFVNCTTVVNVTRTFLPATSLTDHCYTQMFSNCTSLTTAPDLPATTLTVSCYGEMFSNCTSLTTAPQLPATTLARSCYASMFQGCTSLITAPDLPANHMPQSCYSDMFAGCINLTTPPKKLGTSMAVNGTYTYSTCARMFKGCTSLTTAPQLPALGLSATCYSSMFQGCTSLITAPQLPATSLNKSCYSSMFYGCTSLTTAPDLPATSLVDYCYDAMFYNCSNLTITPDLPATTLVDYCYYRMFSNCTSLTTAPDLPATTLAFRCYASIFSNCTSLITAPDLPATTLVDYCYEYMFQGCTSLITAPQLPATTLTSTCYSSMFQGCTSLITAPQLPATTLVDYCYYRMFYGCSKINYIKMLATDISASNCLKYWVSGVSSTGTFVKNPAMTSLPTGSSGIPSSWTVDNA